MLFTNIQLDDFIPTLARFFLGAACEGSSVSPVCVVTKRSPVIYHEDVREGHQMDVDDESSCVPFALPHVSPALLDANLTTELPPMFKLPCSLRFNVVVHSP